jgi:hypothetical protein
MDTPIMLSRGNIITSLPTEKKLEEAAKNPEDYEMFKMKDGVVLVLLKDQMILCKFLHFHYKPIGFH